jgi:hypothetical protein
MKDEYYKKVYIRSAEDLPKKTGSYLCKFKNDDVTIPTRYVAFEVDSLHPQMGINWWLRNIDWYLHPIESNDNAIIAKQDELIDLLERWIDTDPLSEMSIKVRKCKRELAELKKLKGEL